MTKKVRLFTGCVMLSFLIFSFSDANAQWYSGFEKAGEAKFQLHASGDLARGGGGAELQGRYWFGKHFALAGTAGYIQYDAELEGISNKRGNRYFAGGGVSPPPQLLHGKK